MKLFIATISALVLTTSVLAASDLNLKDIKQIICQSTATYEQDTPDQKETTIRGIKIFTPGSRTDVKPRAGAFLLSEYDEQESGGLTNSGDEQFYLQPLKNGKITFVFIADWKAQGEFTINADGSAAGFINQKTHITDLSCIILKK